MGSDQVWIDAKPKRLTYVNKRFERSVVLSVITHERERERELAGLMRPALGPVVLSH